MNGAIIRTTLDLVVRLIDTTTGNPPTTDAVRFSRGGRPVVAMNKGGGNHIFINLGREDFLMRIEVDGYDPLEKQIEFPEEGMLETDVFLMPSENAYRGGRVITLAGRIPGLSSIEAVSLSMPVCSISEFDDKKNIMTLFLPNRRIGMEGVYYGLVHETEAAYERFEVVEVISAVSVRIREPLQEEYLLNSPISRVIFGKVEKDGSFILRVRDSGMDLRYLVRIEAKGEVGFQEVDFHDLKGVVLKAPKKKAARKKEEEPQPEGETPQEES